MTLAFSAAGTAVLRRPDFRTHLAVGALIGTSAMQANLMLIVAVISGANMNKATAGAGAATPPSFQATEAFASMLFMAYSTFTVFVYSWKDMCVTAPAPRPLSPPPPAPLPLRRFFLTLSCAPRRPPGLHSPQPAARRGRRGGRWRHAARRQHGLRGQL